jgi:Ring finger domain
MFTKRRRQIKKTKITNRKRKTQKNGRNGRKITKKITKRNKHSRKFRTRRNKKYSGGGTWIDVDNDDTFYADDECPICFQTFSDTQNLAIYKTYCGHIFHNNCLNRVCDSARGTPRCPICRSELEKAAIGNEPARADCNEVHDFASKELGNPNILDKKNREIYDAQPEIVENDNEEPGIFEQPHGVVPDIGDIPHNNDDDDIGPVRRIYDEEDEEEVFHHVNPVVGRCYDHVEASRREGIYPNIRYFAPSLNRVYVGRFVREERRGSGDGQQIYAIFVDNNGQERRVQYSFGGDTCFIERPCP